MGCNASRSNPKDTRVLVTGGSGYLGQFLVDRLAADGYTILATTHSHNPELSVPVDKDNVEGLTVDGTDSKALQEIMNQFKPSVIINTMAISSPAQCEKIKEKAEKLNSAKAFVDAVKKSNPLSLVIQISTDQVYSGKGEVEGGYTNQSKTEPVNHYGRTKLLAEENIATLENHIILRSSGIYGPPPPRECSKGGTFLQMTMKLLKGDSKSPFFSEEKRSHVYVRDCVSIIRHFVFTYPIMKFKEASDRIFCMGGTGTWARDQYAIVTAEEIGLSKENILPMTREECKFGWAHTFTSPADISMNVTRITQQWSKPKTLREGIRDMIERGEIKRHVDPSGVNDED
ncbi:hypothetical protein AAMO2058_001208600 [Amorphochlora amoebiformis]